MWRAWRCLSCGRESGYDCRGVRAYEMAVAVGLCCGGAALRCAGAGAAAGLWMPWVGPLLGLAHGRVVGLVGCGACGAAGAGRLW